MSAINTAGRSTFHCWFPILIAASVAGRPSTSVAYAPAYKIYPIDPGNNDAVGIGTSVSTNGTFASAYTGGTGRGNGVLFNVSSGLATVITQTGVTGLSGGMSVPDTYGYPVSINNSGVMFGGSGTSGPSGLNAPTVFDQGQAYNLPLPSGMSRGNVYGCTNYIAGAGETFASGSVTSTAGGTQAALFNYYGIGSIRNSTSILSAVTSIGGKLQTAYAINDSLQIVGVAADPTNPASTVAFCYNLGSGAATADIIPVPAGYGGNAIAISSNGMVTGNEKNNVPFLYNTSSGQMVTLPLVLGATSGTPLGPCGVNSSGEVVGTQASIYGLPFLYDGTGSYLLSSLLVNNAAGAWRLSDNISSFASGIADNGVIVGRGLYNGVSTAFYLVPTGETVVTPRNLTFNNAGGTGDGATFDVVQQNFQLGTTVTTFNGAAGDYVTFTDVNSGHYMVKIPDSVTPGSVSINAAGNYTFVGPGGISGTGGLNKSGTGTLTLRTEDSYSGLTQVVEGTLVLSTPTALPPGGSLSVNGSLLTAVVRADRLATAYSLQVNKFSLGPNGVLDLTTNALVVHSTTFSIIAGYVKNGYNGGVWNGTGGVTTSAAGTPGSVMALGVIVNDTGAGATTPLYGVGGAIAATFVGGSVPVDGDALVRYTYYGDANLDGRVDGQDYGRLDAGFASQSTSTKLTGWYNGDFNYDGKVDGTDYTLIDNAFNLQPVPFMAATTGELAAVPEPVAAGVFAIAAVRVVARRRRT